jgi:putative copper resistance protein D
VLLSLQALLVGGVSFLVLILPPPMREGRAESERVELRIRHVLFWCGIALATIQILYAASNSFILMSTAGLRFAEVLGAQFFVASGAIVAASAVLAWVLRRRKSMWCAIGLVLIVLLGSVATGHAWSRMDHRLILATLDLLHQGAAGVWIGGLPILLLALGSTKSSDLATSICQRFSRMAIAGVGMVLVAGIGLVLFYFDSPSAVYGTSYGIMLLGKVGLFLVLAGIGASNKSIVARLNSDISRLLQYLRRNIEAEIGIGFTVLLAAASLTSQPPAIDLPNDRVTLHEAGDRLAPRWPRFSTPDVSQLSLPGRELLRQEAEKAGLVSAYIPGMPTHPETPADKAWSEHNHSWAGLLVVVIGILAVASQSTRVRWVRHWPLLFIGLAIFLQIRSDPENWPLGPNGFWESFLDAEVLQHRFFVLLIVGFAISEWRVQTRRSKRRWHSFAFPVACALGGALLFTHTHALGNIKAYTLIEWSHMPVAFFAVMAGWSRWAELRTGTGKQTNLVWVWSACLVMIGSLLMFYREP